MAVVGRLDAVVKTQSCNRHEVVHLQSTQCSWLVRTAGCCGEHNTQDAIKGQSYLQRSVHVL